jgi:hypothetical protein
LFTAFLAATAKSVSALIWLTKGTAINAAKSNFFIVNPFLGMSTIKKIGIPTCFQEPKDYPLAILSLTKINA